jgi:chemotaxis protein MotB
MLPRRRRSSAPSPERWLLSYADFITLLFAFFVVLFASSHADRSKAKRVSDAVEKAFSGKRESAALPIPSPGATVRNVSGLEPIMGILLKGLRPEIESGKMNVHMEERGIVVLLSQASFFPSGEDAVDPAMIASLGKVADTIAGLPNLIRLEGHTDSKPIRTPRFRSNWDLSSARAIAMMELLNDRWHIAPRRLAVTGYAETVPIDSNETDIGRARNRRVDLVILNAAGSSLEPKGRMDSPELAREVAAGPKR